VNGISVFCFLRVNTCNQDYMKKWDGFTAKNTIQNNGLLLSFLVHITNLFYL